MFSCIQIVESSMHETKKKKGKSGTLGAGASNQRESTPSAGPSQGLSGLISNSLFD